MATKSFETRWHYWESDTVPNCPFTVGYDYGRFLNMAVYSYPTEAEAKAFVAAANAKDRAAGFEAAQALFKMDA